MNIFALDLDPTIAASYHCDQHLHKMILESAQMLSTVARSKSLLASGYYKPTHANHPCTKWLAESLNNCAWLVELCRALDAERLAATNCAQHASMRIINLFEDDFLQSPAINNCIWTPSNFIFAGPMQIAIRPNLSTVEKYRAYYRLKSAQWEREGKGPMTWKNRTIPEWMNE